MADFNRNPVGENGLARILEDLSLQRIKENETIGSIAQIDGLQAALDGKAASSHTHNYAGSSSAGGAATSAKRLNPGGYIKIGNKSLLFVGNETSTAPLTFTLAQIGAAASSHTTLAATSSTLGHVKVDTAMSSTSTNPVQNKVVNTALAGKAASSHTHNYAGSSSAGGAATSANKVNKYLKIQLNSGEEEGSDQFTFNGSVDKTVNITPSGIGAALASHTHDVATQSKAGFLSASDKSKLDSLTIQGDTSGYVSKSGDQMFGPLLFETTHYYNRGHFEGIGSGSFATSAASTSFYAAIGLSNFNQNTSLSLRFNGYNHNNPRVRIDFTVGILITYSSGTRKISTNGWYSEGMLTPSSVTARISGSTLYIYYNFATLTYNYTANTDNIFVRVDAIIHDAPEVGITGLSADVGTETPPTSGLTTLNKLAIASGTYVSWANITGKPNTFTPSTHNQAISTITGRQNLIIRLNGGKTEGSTQFTYNAGTAKTVNITASGIGAALASHSHEIGDITNLQDELDGKAPSSHTTLAATSSVLGHVKVDTAMSSTSTNPVQNKVVNTALAGKAASSHTHNYAGSSSAGGAATSANKVNSSLTINFNGITKATYNGSAAKTVNITAGGIGAALASHTHTYAGSNVAGGAAREAWKARYVTNFGICTSAGNTTAKTVTIPGTFELVDGAEVCVFFNETCTYPDNTLSVNGCSAKYIYMGGSKVSANWLQKNKAYNFRYSESRGVWEVVSALYAYDANTCESASKLKTTRSFKIGQTSKSFNGKANVTWTNDEIGAPKVIALTTETTGDFSTSSSSPKDIDSLIYSGGINNLILYLSKAPGNTENRYYIKTPTTGAVGTQINICLWRYNAVASNVAVRLTPGNGGNLIYLQDGNGYGNVDLTFGAFITLIRVNGTSWLMYRYATV